MPKGIRDKVAILGMGCSKFGERWDMDASDLMVEAYTSTRLSASQIPSEHMRTESPAKNSLCAGKRYFAARDKRPQTVSERSFVPAETGNLPMRPRLIAGIRRTTGNLG
jgi:hypothetical protein